MDISVLPLVFLSASVIAGLIGRLIAFHLRGYSFAERMSIRGVAEGNSEVYTIEMAKKRPEKKAYYDKIYKCVMMAFVIVTIILILCAVGTIIIYI